MRRPPRNPSRTSPEQILDRLRAGKSGGEIRLLLVRLRSLGDTVLITPLFAAAKRLPGCVVGAVVESPFHELLHGNSNLDRILVIPRDKNRLLARLKAVRGFRSFHPDIVVDLHGGVTSAWMCFFSGAPVRVGYGNLRQSYLYNVKVPSTRDVWGRSDLHTVEHQLAPLKYIGFPVEPPGPLELAVTSEEAESMRSFLADLGLSEEFVLIHPGAAFDTKQWPVERFAALGRELSRGGQPVVFTAGPGQGPLLDRIRSLGAADASFIAPLPLRQFMALTAACRLYIGNDTGPTHIAAALGKRIVVIFGSSDARAWFPWKAEHRLLRQDLPCVPCPGYKCLVYKDPLCIRSVEVQAVVEAARQLWNPLIKTN